MKSTNTGDDLLAMLRYPLHFCHSLLSLSIRSRVPLYPDFIAVSPGVFLKKMEPNDPLSVVGPMYVGLPFSTHDLWVDRSDQKYPTDLALASMKRLCVVLSLAGYEFTAYPAQTTYEYKDDFGRWIPTGGVELLSGIESTVFEDHIRKDDWIEECFIEWNARLEPFYRTMDPVRGRVAVALYSYWTGLGAARDDQQTVAFTVVLEALLSTDKVEITHQVSERAAFLLSGEPDKRVRIYQEIKKHYDRRSHYVHGLFKKKKPDLSATAYKGPWNKMEANKLGEIARQILRLALSDADYNGALDSDDKLREYFRGLVFGFFESPNSPRGES